MIRRINILGGPGTGKSTVSSGLYSALKTQNESVELVREYVKEWAYEGRAISKYDQVYLFAKQMRKEVVVLNGGISYIISDSPLPLQIIYGLKSGLDKTAINGLLKVLLSYDKEYPSYNIFLERGDRAYSETGRFQNYEDAVKIDEMIIEQMDEWNFEMDIYKYNHSCEMLIDIIDKIKKGEMHHE